MVTMPQRRESLPSGAKGEVVLGSRRLYIASSLVARSAEVFRLLNLDEPSRFVYFLFVDAFCALERFLIHMTFLQFVCT